MITTGHDTLPVTLAPMQRGSGRKPDAGGALWPSSEEHEHLLTWPVLSFIPHLHISACTRVQVPVSSL